LGALRGRREGVVGGAFPALTIGVVLIGTAQQGVSCGVGGRVSRQDEDVSIVIGANARSKEHLVKVGDAFEFVGEVGEVGLSPVVVDIDRPNGASVGGRVLGGEQDDLFQVESWLFYDFQFSPDVDSLSGRALESEEFVVILDPED